MDNIQLRVREENYSVCQLPVTSPVPTWIFTLPFWSVTRTEDELSLVLEESAIPEDWKAEKGWRCMEVMGPLDFQLVGILAQLSGALAEAGISVFVLSTYNTDYIFVKNTKLDKAVNCLIGRGYTFLDK